MLKFALLSHLWPPSPSNSLPMYNKFTLFFTVWESIQQTGSFLAQLVCLALLASHLASHHLVSSIVSQLQYYESGENRNSSLFDGVDLHHPTKCQAYIGVEWFSHFRAVFFELLCVRREIEERWWFGAVFFEWCLRKRDWRGMMV